MLSKVKARRDDGDKALRQRAGSSRQGRRRSTRGAGSKPGMCHSPGKKMQYVRYVKGMRLQLISTARCLHHRSLQKAPSFFTEPTILSGLHPAKEAQTSSGVHRKGTL